MNSQLLYSAENRMSKRLQVLSCKHASRFSTLTSLQPALERGKSPGPSYSIIVFMFIINYILKCFITEIILYICKKLCEVILSIFQRDIVGTTQVLSSIMVSQILTKNSFKSGNGLVISPPCGDFFVTFKFQEQQYC